jgi:hypothetical protein
VGQRHLGAGTGRAGRRGGAAGRADAPAGHQAAGRHLADVLPDRADAGAMGSGLLRGPAGRAAASPGRPGRPGGHPPRGALHRLRRLREGGDRPLRGRPPGRGRRADRRGRGAFGRAGPAARACAAAVPRLHRGAGPHAEGSAAPAQGRDGDVGPRGALRPGPGHRRPDHLVRVVERPGRGRPRRRHARAPARTVRCLARPDPRRHRGHPGRRGGPQRHLRSLAGQDLDPRPGRADRRRHSPHDA